ncbi:MAG: D-glycero-beta-D-manno-heptose 1-phosphate adenylyltransferase [Rhodospirillales bacterium]|nr:D-glycero-beta-D-manno-heptose 1-phosphate adenylyltransferase [Rhodospirillales bacterium]
MSPRPALLPLVDRLAGARVACIGDLMLDRYVRGRAERISPEAPVPVLSVEDEAVMPGGAGNVARNLLTLGAEARLVGLVGNDAAGAELAALLRTLPLMDAALVEEPGRQTTIKTRYLARAQQILRADRETLAPPAPEARERLLAAALAAVETSAVVILSDYGKGALAGGVAEGVLARAGALGRPAVVDPKGRDFSRYLGATVIAPNRAELAAAVGSDAARGFEAEAARALIARFGFPAVLATLGRDGMLLVTAAEVLALPADARDVFDVSGAGDTVVAAFAAAMAAGAPLAEAAALANVAAGLVVAKVGTAVVRREELAAALRRRDLMAGEGKIATAEDAAERAGRWRRQGLKVGFTNGCFDLLHPGHVSLLAQAKAACDRLVVGLNADASVARLKGAGRPVQGEAARAAVLASLESVDLVVLFAEDTPRRLVEALRPDVLVKGADYRLEQIVGADLVAGWGGQVVLARLEPGYSTSQTIARLGE